MLRTLLIASSAAVFVSALGSAAVAAGPDLAEIIVDTATGNIRLVGNATDPAEVSGYDIVSTDNALIPANWVSLAQQGVAGFGENARLALGVSEASLTTVATVDATGFNLGNFFNPAVGSINNLSFTYTDENSNVIEGAVTPAATAPLPEPASLGLLGLGGLALLRRRRA